MMSMMMMSDGSSTQSNISISASAWSSSSLWTSKLIIKLIMLMLRDRPDFPSLAQTLERLPKKRLARFSIKVYLIFIQLNLHLVASLKPNFVPLPLFCQFHLHLIYIWWAFDDSDLFTQVSFPPDSSVPQCGGALLRSEIISLRVKTFKISCKSWDLTSPHPFPEPPVPLPTSQKLWRQKW